MTRQRHHAVTATATPVDFDLVVQSLVTYKEFYLALFSNPKSIQPLLADDSSEAFSEAFFDLVVPVGMDTLERETFALVYGDPRIKKEMLRFLSPTNEKSSQIFLETKQGRRDFYHFIRRRSSSNIVEGPHLLGCLLNCSVFDDGIDRWYFKSENDERLNKIYSGLCERTYNAYIGAIESYQQILRDEINVLLDELTAENTEFLRDANNCLIFNSDYNGIIDKAANTDTLNQYYLRIEQFEIAAQLKQELDNPEGNRYQNIEAANKYFESKKQILSKTSSGDQFVSRWERISNRFMQLVRKIKRHGLFKTVFGKVDSFEDSVQRLDGARRYGMFGKIQRIRTAREELSQAPRVR